MSHLENIIELGGKASSLVYWWRISLYLLETDQDAIIRNIDIYP